jgi:hypothetical protein
MISYSNEKLTRTQKNTKGKKKALAASKKLDRERLLDPATVIQVYAQMD